MKNLHWPEHPLILVCESIVDCVNKTAPIVEYETPYKMIRTTNVKNGVINLEGARYVKKETFDKWTRRGAPKLHDVVLTREAPLGDVGMITTPNENIFLGQRLMQYRANPEKLDPFFLLYSMQSSEIIGQLKAAGSGSTVEHIRVGDAENIKIKLPPLQVQNDIGNLLKNYDVLIENNNRRIVILEETAQSLYREWFVKFRYPDHENQKLVESPLGLIPERWDLKKLDELVTLRRKTAKKGKLKDLIPYMGLEHFPRKSIALSNWDTVDEIGSNKLEFKKGDILFGKIRPYFHKVGVAQIDGICSTDTFVMFPNNELHHPLIAMVTFSDEFVAQAVQTSQGTKMPRASWDVLAEYLVAIPSKDLLLKFDSVISPAINNIAVLSAKNRNLKTQRDMLLLKLISGSITI